MKAEILFLSERIKPLLKEMLLMLLVLIERQGAAKIDLTFKKVHYPIS
jgi:hypothetical protein